MKTRQELEGEVAHLEHLVRKSDEVSMKRNHELSEAKAECRRLTAQNVWLQEQLEMMRGVPLAGRNLAMYQELAKQADMRAILRRVEVALDDTG